MSGTEIEAPTRRGRAARPQREVHREEPEIVVERGQPEQRPLGDVAATLRTKDAENERLRQQAAEAEQRRLQSEAAARQTHQTEQKARLGETIIAAKAEAEAAAQAFQAARESGDTAAEIAATRRMNTADYRFNEATAELAKLNAAPEQPATPQPQPNISAESRKWLDEHPRMNDDADYRMFAISMDRFAIQQGHRAGSQAYVDCIEREMVRRYGADHAQQGSKGQPMTGRSDDDYRDDGNTRPPASPGGTPRGGARTVVYPIGDMSVRKNSDGSTVINFIASHGKTESEIQRDYEEGARISNPKLFERDKARALGEYLAEAIAAADEGMADLKVGDGRSWGTGRLDE